MTIMTSHSIILKESISLKEVDGEAILVDKNNGDLFGLDPTATVLCQHLFEETTFNEYLDKMKEIFEATEEELKEQILLFLDELTQLGVLDVK